MQFDNPKAVVPAEEILRDLLDPERDEPCVYKGKVVQGALDLRHLVIDRPLELSNCEFLDEVDLRYAEFRHTVDLSSSTFHKHFNSGDPTQSHTIFSKDLLADSSVFCSGATFFGSQFGGSALFANARFEDSGQVASFRGCCFKKYADFDGAVFLGGADFSNIDCGLSVTFIRSRFECETEPFDMWNARIGNILDCSRMVARGSASFERVRCRIIRLNDVRFESSAEPVMLEFLCLEGALYCNDAVFEGPVSFNGMRAEGAFFHDTRFNDSGEGVDFRHSCFQVNLQLRRAFFQGPISLESARIGAKLILGRAVFKNNLSLCNATIGRLELGETSGLAEDSVDLRGFRFESIDDAKIHGPWLLQAQESRSFSRDPYIQLEQYFRSVGDDTDADDMYYRGRCALREHALQDGKPIHWSKSQNLGDLILKWLTGYGVKTERVMLPIVVLLLVAVFVFWPDGMLKPGASTSVGAGSWVEHLFDRAAYSVDLFLPVVDLGICNHWTPANRLGQVYSILHVIAGWLLVPLLLASSSGLVRKR